MDFTLLTWIGIALLAMFFGYFFGLVEGRGQGAKKRRDEEELNNWPGVNLPPPSPPVAPGEKNLLALSFDEWNQPQLKLDSQRVDAAQLSPENRKRLIELMVMMRPWIENSSPQKQASSVQPTQPVPQPVVFAPAPVVNLSAPSKAAAPVVKPAPQPAPTSMVAQIDAILQKRLIGTPLENLGIRLVELPKGDLQVLVGDKSYAGVGEVSDPAVQAALKAAIAEWERIYYPVNK